MANQEHLDLLKQGVKRWNQWRRKHQDVQADLSSTDLSEVDLPKIDLRGTDLSMADLAEIDLRGADLSDTDLRTTNLICINLSGAILRDANLNDAYLCGAILREADLRDASFRGADLISADLSDADLSNADFRDADLSNANLSDADLSGAYLINATLRGTTLRGAYLINANLSGAYLTNADLCGADLSDATLRGANATCTDFSNANLRGTDLSSVILDRTNLSKTHLAGTVFANNDLRAVKGLLEINHQGPSHVKLYAVKLPQDGSALHFLRGVGVPDEWIDFYRAQMMSPIQYYSCFISYSNKDSMLARRLHADLQDRGVRCWFAPEDMKIGDKIRSRIDEAIHLQDKLLLLLSEHSLDSPWVEDEVEAALEKEQRQQREVLFPVRLDESVMQTSQAWATKLRRTRHIGDFTRWTDPQEYQQAFGRLLRDLKAQF